MFKAYLKIGWRNIARHRFYSLVNIGGLAVGIAFVMLIGVYTWQELQVNKQLKNSGNQYIIQSEWKDPNMGLELTTLAPLAKALKEHYPDLVRNYYRWDGISANVSVGDKHFRESTQIGDSTLLTMYGFSAVSGDAAKALNQPFSAVITEENAMKYFGKTNVAGQFITIENFSGSTHEFKITAVIRRSGENSVTKLNSENDNQLFLPLAAAEFFGRANFDNWQNSSSVGYVELQPGIKPEALEKAARQLVMQNAPPEISAAHTPHVIALTDYYLDVNHGLVRKTLYILSAIAFFILLMAVINFVNISISGSTGRMKEIGVRKALGGIRKQLITQFLTESFMIAFFAVLVALGLYGLLNPYFSDMLGKELPHFYDLPAISILYFFLLWFVIGVLGGIYPALVMSSFRSPELLKGKLKTISEKFVLRKALVGFQFFIAAIVFVGGLIISEQVSLFFSDNLGYDKNYVVSLPVPRDWTPEGLQHMEMVRKEIAGMPQVAQASVSYVIPNGNASGSFSVYKEGMDSTQAISSLHLEVDKTYAATYGIPMSAGAFWPDDETPDRAVINESAVKALGMKDAASAIGQRIIVPGYGATFTVCGVTKDFHFGTMKEDIRPVTFISTGVSNFYRVISIKLRPGNMTSSLAALREKWSVLLPDAVFEYKFMDETLAKLYQSELRLKKASFAAIVLMIIVVLLGVLGLVSISIQKRTREIGIRKVLGSSVREIVTLFMKELLPVIFIATLIACIPAYFLMQYWLSDYAYRVAITPQPFVFSVLVLGAITTLLIGMATIRAALANPVKSLRTE